MLLLWHLNIYYHNNCNSIPSLTLKVLLRKARRAARGRLIHPPPSTLPTGNTVQELQSLQTMQQGVQTASGPPNTPTLTQTHNSNRVGQEAPGPKAVSKLYPSKNERKLKIFPTVVLGQGLGIISIRGCSSSRPHFKFSRGNVESNYENRSTIWHSCDHLYTSKSSFYCSKHQKRGSAFHQADLISTFL